MSDCNKTNGGCGGGTMNKAFTYLKSNPLTTEEHYPYLAINKPCDKSLIKPTLYSIKDFTKNPSGDVNGLKKLLL